MLIFFITAYCIVICTSRGVLTHTLSLLIGVILSVKNKESYSPIRQHLQHQFNCLLVDLEYKFNKTNHTVLPIKIISTSWQYVFDSIELVKI